MLWPLNQAEPDDNPVVRKPTVANTPVCSGLLKVPRQNAGQLLVVCVSDQVPPRKVVQFFTSPTTAVSSIPPRPPRNFHDDARAELPFVTLPQTPAYSVVPVEPVTLYILALCRRGA